MGHYQFVPGSLVAFIVSNSIAGQSMRAGGATALAEAGVPPQLIQAAGRWTSDTFTLRPKKPFLICLPGAPLYILNSVFSFSPQAIAIGLILSCLQTLPSIIHCSNPLILIFHPSLLSLSTLAIYVLQIHFY